MDNACAKEIKRIAKDLKPMARCSWMDNQGAVVGEKCADSDYWQCDEPKWTTRSRKARAGWTWAR